MPNPRTIKEVQKLSCYMASLGRLVSNSTQEFLLFFKWLRSVKDFRWTEEAERAFKQLKQYLSDIPSLSSPRPREDLYICLSASEVVVSAVLIKEENKKQISINFINLFLTGPELNYPNIEKLALILIIAARKLRLYFKVYPIRILTDQPLKKMMQKYDYLGMMLL